MPVPMKFIPDPHIPGAADAGIGDLHYDDGTVKFIEDPELAGYVNQYPDSVDEINAQSAASGAVPGALPPEGPPLPPGGAPDPNGDFMPWSPSNAPGTTGALTPAGWAPTADNPLPPAPAPPPPDLQAPALTDAQKPPDPNGIPDVAGEAMAAGAPGAPGGLGAGVGALPVGSPANDAGAPPVSPAPGGGLQVAERVGRLDPEVAARQAGERSAQDATSLKTLQEDRDTQEAIERNANFAERGRLRAQMEEQQAQQQEHQQKLAGFQGEQRQIADAHIDSDLLSAQGPGAFLSVLGAAMLGATGSDAGLRMIDKAIDRHVQNQVQQRGSKLHIIAEQIGSEQQAVQMAKAKYYEAAAKHAEQLQKLTAVDAYHAQTPGIVDALKQKQLEASQKAEVESLGKITEKVPVVAKAVPPEVLEKYGAARKEALGAHNVMQSLDQSTGLIWDPNKNDFANEAEIHKKGIAGIGNIEHLIPDAIYSISGGVGDHDGYQIRGKVDALAYVRAKQLAPTARVTQNEIDSVKRTMNTNSEAGLISTMREMHQQAAQEQKLTDASFPPEVVAEFNRRSGGVSGASSPGQTQSATPADIQAELAKRKQPGAAANGEPVKSTIEDVRGSIAAQTGKELPPEGQAILYAQAQHETNDGKSAPGSNYFGIKGKGNNLETTEGAGAQAKKVRADFKAYGSPDESVADMTSLLKRNYPTAWTALQHGDVNAYVEALHQGGYFTADPTAYLKGIQRRL